MSNKRNKATIHEFVSKNMNLYDKLNLYGSSDYYPFHMPGHKRNKKFGLTNPVEIDITEITDFDNLHHSEGILLKEQEFAARLYGADKSYFLVNGSTCGILAAVSACVERGGKLLICRNAHKSVYHAAYLRQLQLVYLEAKESEIGFPLPVTVQSVERALQAEHMDALLITSPTYEGLTADIAAIVKVAHSYNVPVIVDEAHGAHLGFHSYFPVNALSQGADIVVQSLHKTLPSLTQTALLHIGKEAQDYVERSKVERFLGIYQTSSPSYVFMGAMAKCLHAISGEQFERFAGLLQDFYEKCSSFRHVHVYHELECEGCGQRVLGQDYSKLIIYTDNNLMNGQALFECLQDEYHLECEMAAPLYVLAMTSFCDTKEGFERLWKALGEIDIRLEEFLKDEARCNGNEKYSYDIARYVDSKNLQSKTAIADRNHCHLPEVICTIDQAIDSSKKETINLKNAAERVSAEYIYCYPPGAPIIVPGERIREEDLAYIEEYQEIGLNMQGLDDYHFQKIKVLKEPI